MPQCAKTWVSLRSRSRSLNVCLRARPAKRLTQEQPPPKHRPRKKKLKRLKRLPPSDSRDEQDFLYGHAFDVLLALGLVPSQDRIKQEDDLKLGLNRMHVMEGECDKTSEMVAESAPVLVAAKTTDLKLSKEDFPPAEQASEIPERAVESTSPPPEQGKQPGPLVNGEVRDLKEAEVVEEKKEEKEKTEENCISQSASCEKVVNGENCDSSGNVITNGVSGSVEENENKCEERERTKSEAGRDEKEDAKECVKEAEVREGGSGNASGAVSEEEDRNSVTSSQQSRKRAALAEGEGEGEGSSSESDVGGKRPRMENEDGEDERERLVREYVEECTESMEDMSRSADKLQREIGALGELLRAKELEWNSILRLRKLKEEMLERLLRRRRLSALLAENGVKEEYSIEREKSANKASKVININSFPNNPSLMMVPVVSSSPSPTPSPGHMTNSLSRGGPNFGPGPRMPMRLQRPILPKPPGGLQQLSHHDQNSVIAGEGRQGAILDVKSLIADYRSRHPDSVPRRGRRMRSQDGNPPRGMIEPQPPIVSSTRISGSPALMSMANMALGSGSHVRENSPFMVVGQGQDNSRPSSADSSRGHHLEMLSAPNLSFKDALVQFAKMSQPPKPPPPPPPYPEVTLHPVSPPPPSHSHTSLLHGILTKSGPANMPPQPHQQQQQQQHRATTFSPTLARLLTAPERAPHPHPHHPHGPINSHGHFRPPANRREIGELISSSKKNRNEITITPVSGSNKTKDDVVMLGDDEEEGDGDRLVIDEGRDSSANSELPENVPECQGCHQRSAQFVCAGCGNQWYCSRECQVTAWEEHSEMCSG